MQLELNSLSLLPFSPGEHGVNALTLLQLSPWMVHAVSLVQIRPAEKVLKRTKVHLDSMAQ